MDHSLRIVRVFLWTVSITCLLLLVVGAVVSAPAPMTQKISTPQPSHDLVGDWVIHWQGGTGEVTFRREGGYSCKWFGQPWIGHWSLADGMLTVTEAIQPTRPDMVPNWYTWKVTLEPGKRVGKLPTGGSFSLTPRKKAKPDF